MTTGRDPNVNVNVCGVFVEAKKLDSIKFAYMATVTRYFCLHLTSVLLSRYVCSYTLFFYKSVVFPAQAGYSYFSADWRRREAGEAPALIYRFRPA